MNIYYITGASSGIGEAIAELLLEDSNNIVFGIARSRTIQHDRYKHFYIDLSTEWTDTIFKKPTFKAEKIILINNAGSIGPIKPLQEHSEQEIKENYFLNIIAPTILCKQFISAFSESSSKCIVLNISSGAGKHPIHSWSTYCSSKSALDMLSMTADLEPSNVKFYSVAPGIVDTPMQDDIRHADEKHFPELNRFIAYKNEGELSSPLDVAQKYVDFLNNSSKFKEVLYSVRDF